MDSRKNRKLNTFVFKSFHELLNEVHISSLRRKDIPDVENETSSFFGESLRKWRELNCTQQFVEFVAELQGEVDSLLLVIHNQKLIVACLERHLLSSSSLALEPLIDLTVQLSRDLQSDFYENYFKSFFNIFIAILGKHHHDVNIIRSIFVAFSFLFKSMQKNFLSNIEDTFNLFCPLLNAHKYKDYMNKFSAEAFSFLMRKYKDMKYILTFVMRAVTKDNDLKLGISKLLLEMVKGLRHQFYSQTPMILSTLMDIIGEDEFHVGVVEELLQELWKLMCLHTNVEHSSVIVNCTMEKLSEVHKSRKDGLSSNWSLQVIMKLILVLIKYKKGVLIKNDSYLIEVIEQLFIATKDIEPLLLEIVSSVLMSDLPAHHRPNLLALAYNGHLTFEAMMNFTNSIIKISLFEKDALVHLMKHCQKIFQMQPGNVLQALTLFVVKKYDSTVCNRELYSKYVPKLGGFISSILRSAQNIEGLSLPDMHNLWAALLCLPFTKISSGDELKEYLDKHVLEIIKSAKASNSLSCRKRLLCLLKQAVKASICVFEDDLGCLNDAFLTMLISDFTDDEEALNMVLMCLEEVPHFTKTDTVLFERWLPHLQENLLAPYSELRRLSLKILSWFKVPLSKDSEQDALENVFQVCLEAENTLASLSTYRDKLNWLQKLSYDVVEFRLPIGCSKAIPLKYLISQLYVNFQLFWNPIKNLIATYAEGLDSDVFWGVFGKQVELAGRRTLPGMKEDYIMEEVDFESTSSITLEHMFLRDCFSNQEAKKLDRPNNLTFRDNLWSCMMNFSGRCEKVPDVIVPIFFCFLEEEYRYKWDNMLYRKKENPIQEDTYARVPDKYLVLHLKLFAAFVEPKKLNMKQKLFDLYMELLKMNSVEIQKAAFACLLTYKLPYLTAYKENFERLLDEKLFKDELVVFTFEEEKCIVSPVHRHNTVPVILRILLGKMRMKIGRDANGRSLGHARTNTILTYLASFNRTEIMMSLDLFFESILHMTTNDIQENVMSIISGQVTIDLPLKKQQSLLSNIELIIKKLGHKMDGYLDKILNILLCFGSSCNYLLMQRRDSLLGPVINLLKNIRTSVYGHTVEFFELFHTFPFETRHIEAMFHAIVWPQLKKLPVDAISNPTTLLKLLHCWSKYPRLHVLLAKISPDEENLAPFPIILEILKVAKIDASVVTMVFEMIENLLDDEAMEDDQSPLIPGATLDLSCGCQDSDITFGTSLVVRFLKEVLESIEKTLTNDSQTGKRKILGLSQQFSILSKLSQYVMDGSLSEKLCEQLILLMSLGCKVSTENELKILKSVKHLVSRVENVSKFIGPLTPLFERISNPVSRNELSLILQEIGNKDGSYHVISEIVVGLNAIDRSRLDEPDYVARMAAFSKASEYLNGRIPRKGDGDIMLLSQSCIFILITSSDRTFRERSLACLEEMIKYSVQTSSGESFINQNIVPLLKKHLQIGVEDHRHCMIKLLQILVVNFENNVHFQSLRNLCDFEDEEKDFFLNIVHIQLHRRARALRKLAQFLIGDASVRTMPSKVLTSYILPLVLSFLKATTDELDLYTAAVEALSSISLLLPWNSYVRLLKDYLNVLTKTPANQKLIVRIVVALIDSFHFDLRKSSLASASQHPDEEGMDWQDNEADVETADENENKLKELDVGRATKIHVMLLKHVLPALNQCLTHKAKGDDQHKLVREKYAEDEEILRVPIALAMIKLLQKLPPGSLEKNLNGIALKLCFFLGSRAKDIRNIARDTIKKAIVSLGASYLHHFITAMKSHLCRGYQVHVLCYTIWSILEEMNLEAAKEENKFFMKAGDLDACIPSLNEIFHKELFTEVAEEKEVDAISRKIFEASTTKSYDSYRLLAMWISVAQLPQLVLPLKEVLDQTNSHKVINKVSNCLNKISVGLIENKSLSVKFILTFVHGLTSEALLNFVNQRNESDPAVKQDGHLRQGSCLILETAPPRVGIKAKNDSKANLYVLIEFGLNVLHLLLKHSFVDMKTNHHLEMLDPFVSVLSKSLDSKHTVVCTAALKCLMRLLRFPLPSISNHIKKISTKMFLLIKTYSTIGAGKNEHSDMIDWCFKSVQVLVQFVTCHNITENQLHVLLMYAERDLHDYSKHATAFPLLHAILCRKLNAPELTQIMATVQEMSVKSEQPDVQSKCRKALMTYLLDYPLDSKTMEGHVKFLARQLEYEYEAGRLSALETINNIIKLFPKNILDTYCIMFFLQLSQSRLNDDSIKCVNMASENIKFLLKKISLDECEKLRSLVFEWMGSSKSNVLMLMTMVLSIFVEVETVSFNRHLKSVFPVLCDLIHPEAFKKAITNDNEQLERDRLLFCLLGLLHDILSHCNVIRDPQHAEILAVIWGHLLNHCKYEYEPVRLKAAQLFKLLFNSWNFKELVTTSLQKANNMRLEYLQIDFIDKLHALLGTFSYQLTADLSLELANEVCGNLLCLLEILLELPENLESSENSKVSVHWLIQRMCKEVNIEVIKNHQCTLKRNSIFVWMGAAAEKLGPTRIRKHLKGMMTPLVREMLDNNPHADVMLKTLAQEVLDHMKCISGVEEFTRLYALVNKTISSKKCSAKAAKSAQVSTNPEAFAKRKIKKNLAKRESKKRKMEGIKPFSKKRRLNDAISS